MGSTEAMNAESRTRFLKYAVRSNRRAALQCLNTLAPYLTLFYLTLVTLNTSIWMASVFMALLVLFTVRIFMLMHDCGHRSLFRTQWLNTVFGVITGVFVSMPQYVWAQHHNYHHATNGNWEKYRGPLAILSVREYAKLTPKQQKRYRFSRSLAMAPLGAFMYFIFNPRFNWMRGSILFVRDVIRSKRKAPHTPLKEIVSGQKSRFWNSGAEYLHMTINNVLLISIWVAASWHFGAATFFAVYLISLSLAGAIGIIVFTIQHNFEGSYASDTQHWSYQRGALEGTSFLVLPKVINWFGADIAYHHVHHLSAAIPNYRLAACHRDNAHLFEGVTRLKLGDIAKSFRQILWDEKAQKIISVARYERQLAA